APSHVGDAIAGAGDHRRERRRIRLLEPGTIVLLDDGEPSAESNRLAATTSPWPQPRFSLTAHGLLMLPATRGITE
ncbi:MAG TPA: hypothetical protein VL971_08240, partial [Rhizomicrobium sp.]|nr:hypothetical protein [Rhizomicrobium sp.]